MIVQIIKFLTFVQKWFMVWGMKQDAMQRFVIVRHSSGAGYVVRTGYVNAEGTEVWVPNPYSGAYQIKVYKSRSAAEKFCEGMNSLNSERTR